MEVARNISDTPHSGRPSGFDEDHLNTLIHNDPRQCTRELTNMINCNHSTIVRHLHSMDKVKKSGVWVPHALKPQKSAGGYMCISACSLLLLLGFTTLFNISGYQRRFLH